MENKNIEVLERKITMGVLKKDKSQVVDAIREGAMPTFQLFHHALSEKADDIALIFCEHLHFTQENRILIELVTI